MFSSVTVPVADNTTLKMRKATQTIKLDAAGMRVISGFFADFCFQLVIFHVSFFHFTDFNLDLVFLKILKNL